MARGRLGNEVMRSPRYQAMNSVPEGQRQRTTVRRPVGRKPSEPDGSRPAFEGIANRSCSQVEHWPRAVGKNN